MPQAATKRSSHVMRWLPIRSLPIGVSGGSHLALRVNAASMRSIAELIKRERIRICIGVAILMLMQCALLAQPSVLKIFVSAREFQRGFDQRRALAQIGEDREQIRQHVFGGADTVGELPVSFLARRFVGA